VRLRRSWRLPRCRSFSEEAGFPAIYPVNPKYSEVLGLRCHSSLLDIPGEVDHVIVNIPAESALELLDECAMKGVKSVHFFTAGSGNRTTEKANLEKDLLVKARAGGFRIIGPNCIGLYVPRAGCQQLRCPSGTGANRFISQSGGHAPESPDLQRRERVTIQQDC